MTTPLYRLRPREASREPAGSVLGIHDGLDRLGIPYDLSEKRIEAFVVSLRSEVDGGRPEYWLTLARLTEAALLCAGHYADNCEFSAAGDLLVNPRKVDVFLGGLRTPLTKPRHGRVSDVLAPNGSLHWLKDGGVPWRTRIARGPLLPELVSAMQDSGRVAEGYLRRVQRRMERVADTIAFLSAWFLADSADLYRRRQSADTALQTFIDEHLCRFRKTVFVQLGLEIRRLAADPGYRSAFLVDGPSSSSTTSSRRHGMYPSPAFTGRFLPMEGPAK